MHINQCILLAKQKKHLLIEKPLSHNLKDLNKLEKILKKNKLTSMIAYIFRFHPGVILAKKILNEKKIGKLYILEVNFLNFFQIGIRMKIIESFIWPKNKAVAQYLISVI